MDCSPASLRRSCAAECYLTVHSYGHFKNEFIEKLLEQVQIKFTLFLGLSDIGDFCVESYDEWRVAKGLKGSGCDIVVILSRNLPGRSGKSHEQPQ